MLREVIGAAEYHIDFHAGDVGELLYPFAGYSLTGKRELERGARRSRAPSRHSSSRSRRAEGTIPPFAGSLNYSATRNGVVSILAESGGDATLDEEDVRTHVDGALNVMRHLGMIDGEPSANGRRIAARDRVVVRAKRAGLLR